MKRLRYEVRLVKPGTWGFFPGEGQPVYYDNKGDCVEHASGDCRLLWRRWGIRTELLIKARDGRIIDTRTYGEDPRRTKG